MSVSNPPSATPAVIMAAQTQLQMQGNLKRSVQTAFEEPADSRKMAIPGYTSKVRVHEKYKVVGFISSGTYGRVYKAIKRNGEPGDFAIKKFKPDKEDATVTYTGISQSAIREMALCSELSHPNLIHCHETILEDKCIFMVFEYCEHDLLQIIHHHTQPPRHPIPSTCVKSVLFQLLNGLQYLHTNWVLHRDLKPANIMVTSRGEVRIGDLGLARLFHKPLSSLYSGDKVVVTIWYRAPELLLGSKHYTPAIDLWAVGCIFAELLSLRPIFKGEEAKMDNKKTVPFQANQMQKVMDIMGPPTREKWKGLVWMAEHSALQSLIYDGRDRKPIGLENWWKSTLDNAGYNSANEKIGHPGDLGLDLLKRLLEYDPEKRLTAREALVHPYFGGNGIVDDRDADASAEVEGEEGYGEEEGGGDRPFKNCFQGVEKEYPHRRVSNDDNDIRTSSLPGTKRAGLPDDSRPGKRIKE